MTRRTRRLLLLALSAGVVAVLLALLLLRQRTPPFAALAGGDQFLADSGNVQCVSGAVHGPPRSKRRLPRWHRAVWWHGALRGPARWESGGMIGAAATVGIGRVRFVDGANRDVYEDIDGRQCVTGYDGEPVYGVWLLTAEAEPDAGDRAGLIVVYRTSSRWGSPGDHHAFHKPPPVQSALSGRIRGDRDDIALRDVQTELAARKRTSVCRTTGAQLARILHTFFGDCNCAMVQLVVVVWVSNNPTAPPRGPSL